MKNHESVVRTRFVARRHAVALAALTSICGAAHATVSTTGSVAVYPNAGTVGPGNTNLGNSGLVIGSGNDGGLKVDAASLLQAGALIGASGAPSVNSTVLVTGAGSRIELNGDPIANGWLNRLEVSAWGHGSLTVAAGASLDTTLNAGVCATNSYCSTLIGNFAGADATFRVTGAGSSASLLRTMGVAGVSVFAPPQASFTAGTPGGSTVGRVQVDSGAVLRTDAAVLGLAPGGTNSTGSERSFAEVVVSGANSLWRVTGGSIASDNLAATVATAAHANAWATLTVGNGGALRFEGDGNTSAALNLTTGGGRTDALVTGSGSRIDFASASGVLQVGRSLGSATLQLRDGGVVGNVWYSSVGRDGSFGTLAIDGAGTLYSASGTATAAAAGSAQAAVFDIGRGGGNGVVDVTSGGRLEVVSTTAKTNGPTLNIGRDAASNGTLNISGAGSTVLVRAASVAPGTSAEAFNPFVRIGRDGSGTLNITGGGKLIVEGNAVSTVSDTRRTNVYIGGSGDATVGGRGTANISGAGSELRVSGSDAYVGVGHGPQASGNLSVSAQGSVSATILGIGNMGGTGVARFDNASVNLSGQYTGSGEYGAALVIGAGSGAVGSVTAVNGSTIRVATTAANGGGVTLGGSRSTAGGDGTLSLSGSSLVFDVPLNNSALTVGRSGSGLLRMDAGSTLALGGNSLFVGRDSGSSGTLIATGGSTLTAGFVGVGATRSNGQLVNGGTGTMVLNGATLYAQDVYIGSNGYLGGSAGAIHVSGSVVNYGIFSPGSSPGLFTIDGNFQAGAGSRLILEVQADGAGGFKTDEVDFTFGKSLDLNAASIEFRFLGNTDPNAFLAQGLFGIDHFLRQADAQGTFTNLVGADYAGATFSARSDAYTIGNFIYSVANGPSFTATALAVPEPQSWALLLVGIGVIAITRRRRSSASRSR